MLRSNWGFIVAAFGLALATPGEGQETRATYQQGNSAGQSQLENIAVAIRKLPQGSPPDGGCPDGKEQRQSDLCAQWKAADAASDAAWWTMLTFWAAVVGLSIAAGTLFAAIRAALYAKSAVDEARRAADAGDEAVDLSREAMIVAHRAYVSFREMKPLFPTTGPEELITALKIELQFFNTGNTPAINFRAFTNLHLVKVAELHSHDFNKFKPVGDYAMPIGPSTPIDIDPRAALTLDALYGLADRTHRAFLHTRITYNDMFEGTPERLTETFQEIIMTVVPRARPFTNEHPPRVVLSPHGERNRVS